MIVITDKEVYSDLNKYVHRIGTDVYFKRSSKLKTDIVDNFEEVDNIPNNDDLIDEKERKLLEISEYDKSKNVNIFYVNDIPMWYNYDRRASIKNLVESNIKLGNESITLWTEEEPIISITVKCEDALLMLAKLEVYAGNCLSVTQQHKVNVNKLTTKEEIEQYDYTVNYPEKLKFEIK